jgi:hypothetical protein
MRTYNERRHAHAGVAHAEMNGVARIGLLLSLIGLVAFGAYTAFFLVGFIGDLVG